MEYKNSNGEGGRCDAKCYNAVEDECQCCCGGVNHGVGLKRAIDNTTRKYNEIIEWAQNNGYSGIKLSEEIGKYMQPSLFD
jgi:alpha-galactosidase/6-phospho-beta-glucosidase family protein